MPLRDVFILKNPQKAYNYHGDIMNKSKLFKLSVAGFVFVSILGTLSHFVYEWSNYNIITAPFVPVNESIWEHLKLLFFPYIIWAVIQYYIMKKEKGLIISKAIGSLAGMATIVIFFYTYSGISGKSIDILNILSFFIGIAIAFVCDNYFIKSSKLKNTGADCAGVVLIIVTAALFFIFTFAPPFAPLFKDPISSTYGI